MKARVNIDVGAPRVPKAGAYEGQFFTVAGGTHGARSDSEREVVVVGVSTVASDIVALTVSGVDGPLPLWTAGSHVDVILPDGRLSQYSLSGDPSRRGDYRLAVLRSHTANSVSHDVHALRPGDHLTIRGPRNQFSLVPAPSYLFIAGGIGITPIMAMMRSATAAGVPWRMFYLGRSRSGMAFIDEIETWGDVVIWAHDERGERLDIGKLLAEAPGDAVIYCCGPQSLLADVEERGAEVAPGRVRIERFTVPLAENLSNTTFEVRCELSDITLTVAPGTTILAEANRRGIPTVSSCNRGICGTCETVVLEGVPDHRDSVLDDDERAEGDTMMICVSRAVGPRLVLDL